MKLLLRLPQLSFYLVLCSGWVTIGTAKTTTTSPRRHVQTTSTTTTLIENILMADLLIIENGTKLQATVTYQGYGYVSLAFSLDKFMAGSFAVIGLPAAVADGSSSSNNTGNVAKYELTGRVTPTLMSSDRQTLTDTSVTTDGMTTILKFTKLLNETGEVMINPNGDNIFLFAVGPDGLPDQLVFHKQFGDVTVNFVTGISAASDPNEYKTLWLCHGILLALAWVILIPIGTGCSVARALFPTTTSQPAVAWWFQLHRSLNMCGVILTIVGFAIAVYVIQAEQGATAQHFTERPHHKIGLAVMIVAVVNALMGIFRPPAPHAAAAAPSAVAVDEDDDAHDVNNNKVTTTTPDKTPARVAFEYGHRVFGLAAIIMAWFNVGSGAELIHIKYVNDIKDLSLVAWIIMAIIATLVLILGMVGRSQK